MGPSELFHGGRRQYPSLTCVEKDGLDKRAKQAKFEAWTQGGFPHGLQKTDVVRCQPDATSSVLFAARYLGAQIDELCDAFNGVVIKGQSPFRLFSRQVPNYK